MKKAKKSELRYNEDDERTLLEDILGFIKVFVVSAIVILLFVNFVAHPVRVDGRSMYPTLKDGEFGFTNVGGVLLNGVKRGDIVVVTMEEKGQKTHWVKRVIGMPGDTISCVNDIVFINGKVLDETQYIDPDYRQSCVDQFGYFNKVPNADNSDVQDFEEVKLGDDEYYVMGDNRPYSKDSRYVGPVKKSQLFAKKMLVLLPISDIGVKD
ncbi:signal peptidase I [Holdemanella biformis]|jgi:signal peptidase I|uniref:Signal peptidase I n=2 Tax=Holdemanella biformis TaxID=1735 RepID=B7CD53_9FIRM|nr:signal peptidase I [Holdemanella biformis]EEC89358.1 signal peptidase I [Holdemanella biformis DSM 3989]RGW71841.1 signal peptidase I [Holdemanella biformis]